MAIIIGDNFNYQGKQSNFARDSFKTLAEMKAYPETSLDNGHRSFCIETKKYYEYLDSNSVDSTLGRWRLITDTSLNGSSENPVQNKVITAKFAQMTADAASSLLAINKQLDSLKKELEESISESEQINSSAFGSLYQQIEDMDNVISRALADLQSSTVSNDVTINGHLLEGNVELTKADVGLSKVDNTGDIEKPISSATQIALDKKVDKKEGFALASQVQLDKLSDLPDPDSLNASISQITENLSNHADNVNNPHQVTAAQAGAVPTTRTVNGHALSSDITLNAGDVGLNKVNNTSDLEKPISTATQGALNGKVDKVDGKALSTNDYTTAEKNKLAGIETGAQVNKVTSVAGKEGAVTLEKGDVGLENVDNTADYDKPLSKEAEESNYITVKTFGELVERIKENEEAIGKALNEISMNLGYALDWIKNQTREGA